MTLIVDPDSLDEAPYVERPSGLIVPRSVERPERFTGIDLFAGAGGMSLGFIQAGCQVVAALDNWATAAVTYMYNLGAYPCRFHFSDDQARERLEKDLRRDWNKTGIKTMLVSGGARAPYNGEPHDWPAGYPGVEHFFFGDARAFTGSEILQAIRIKRGEVGCVFGGPPCQGFSTSGKRNVMDPRNSLVFEFARLVCEIKPRTVVMENVPGIVNMVTPEGLPVLDKFCLILEEGGFGAADALKKSLLGKAGRGAAVRRKPTKRGEKRKGRKKPKPQDSQPRLFDHQAAGKAT